MNKIVIFGPGPIFKGGIADFTSSLALSLDQIPGIETHIVSWTNPYPRFIPRDFANHTPIKFPTENELLHIHYLTNYNNPRSWYRTFQLIQRISPDLVIFEWSTAVQSLPIAYIARKLRRKTSIRIVFDLHYIKSVRHTSLVEMLTQGTIKYAHHYIVHSIKAACELKALFPKTDFALTDKEIPVHTDQTKVILQLFHPVYNIFPTSPSTDIAALKQQLHLKKYVFLFFGFLYKYKGLHHVIEAFANLCKERDDVSLLIVGESSWQASNKKENKQQLMTKAAGVIKADFLSEADDERNYHPLDKIEELHISDSVTVINKFIPAEEVAPFFEVSDNVMLYYEAANASGIEAIANQFRIPILATRVGHFPETIKDGYNGYLAEVDNLASMTHVMKKAILEPIDRKNIEKATQNMSWSCYAQSIVRLLPASNSVQN